MSEPILPRVAAGDPEAVQACIDTYGRLVWWLARKHAAGDAEDAVQEIFISLWQSAPRFDARKSSEPAFVAMVARRRLIDRRRRADRRPQTETLEAGGVELPSQASSAEVCAEAALAARAVQQLDPKERSVLLLSVYHGLSHSEIVEKTGLPLGTVKTYIRRGLARVRDRLTAGQTGGREASP